MTTGGRSGQSLVSYLMSSGPLLGRLASRRLSTSLPAQVPPPSAYGNIFFQIPDSMAIGADRASFSTTTTIPCGSPRGFIPTAVPCDGVLTHPQTLNKSEAHHSSHIGPPSAYGGLIGGHRPLLT
ncbi:hypothetical protein BDM02DRAFT_3117545 [Thelephora ganbajun]|uniref:Uncharacterized protein n=1 Tax=Thelephora ganbajun TaxID=370292 RepID=A0ACB6ZCB7_THEGA|nr:hypothetical protein BDM02DRAFT_3117545 [Thelephora ganbajun]